MGTRLVVGFVLVLGCGDRTESGTVALQSTPEASRNPTSRAAITIAAMDMALDADDTASIEVDHECASGVVASAARVLSEAQMTSVSLGSSALVRDRAAQFIVSPQILQLKDAELPFSGSIRITSFVECANGVTSKAHEYLFFHRVGGKWQLYDRETRDSVYAGGVLDSELAAIRASMRPNQRTGFTGAAFVEKISDNPNFVSNPEERN